VNARAHIQRIASNFQGIEKMIIFIGNLPAVARDRDPCVFADLVEGMIPRIIKKHDVNGGLYRYALVQCRTEREGRRLIGRLHGRTCHDHTLVAREFRNRTAGNERRRLDWRELPWTGPERRVAERRSITPYRR
jgi:hypothetical protein